jgi:tetratricopeptide (TPR) repeat protein
MPTDTNIATDQLLREASQALQQERPAVARAALEELTRREPAHAPHWMNLGTVLRQLQHYEESLTAYAQAAALGERSSGFYYNVGLLHMDRGDFDTARRLLADAAAAAPRDAEICCQYAECCYESLRIEEATAALAGWRQFAGLDSERLAAIGLLLLNLGETASAYEAEARAAADQNPSVRTLLHLAQIQERTNRLAEAQATLQRLRRATGSAALSADLQLLEAQLALRVGDSAQAVYRFTALASACDEPYRRHQFLFPLAKALDTAGRRDECFQRLQEAHAGQMLHVERVAPGVASQREPPLLITRYSCDKSDVSAWDETSAPGAEASPVFIVAFPRSGTTLLEQMLDAHPGLVTMDEQPYLQQAIDRIQHLGIDYPAGLAQLSNDQLAEVREYYWSLTRRKVQLHAGQRLIDKNPLNLLRLPAIRRLFPQSPILLAIRHPCDVLWSCFMQHFRAPEFALLCRDLPTLARSYRRCFDFWFEQQALLQPLLREVRYEAFVADFAAESKAITAFLGLQWHEAQLAPGAHARAKGYISTPSYAQVLEPVTQRAVGRWQAYAPHFSEALAELRPYLERWGYDG